ncbi:hypothetical protein [Kitasatospora sp. NPDC059327]|uniref:hypothetical protein n=1 Tax=Kitasatospora sp. NPDC059327 TaxID=3346803 RepID=UPI00367BFC71
MRSDHRLVTAGIAGIHSWWFLRCSRAPVARLLRAERRRLDAEVALHLPEAARRIRWRVQHELDLR